MSLHVSLSKVRVTEVYNSGITHNLNSMAMKAGIYKHLWRPDEMNITKASELIEPLTEGLKRLKDNPEYYKKFNPSNGWGDYEGLVKFVEDYIAACKTFPSTTIEADR